MPKKMADPAVKRAGKKTLNLAQRSIILQMYKDYAEVEIYDPRVELKRAKNTIENYLRRRTKVAWVIVCLVNLSHMKKMPIQKKVVVCICNVHSCH